jgi:hypothetical protein
MVSEENPFSPPGELARLHIRSAVHHLLQHQPVQGKYALERLMVEIDSDYFPANKKAALVAFSSGPLKRPCDSLVRNLVVILCTVSPTYSGRVTAGFRVIADGIDEAPRGRPQNGRYLGVGAAPR